MAKLDLVEDITRACRIGKRLFEGDLTLSDVLLNRNPVRPAKEGEPKCEKTPGCVGAANHEGGCIFDATEVETPAPQEANGT